MRKTVSIIIPVYNAEKYLVECLGNVVNQTLDNIEVILVNDASTDGSLQVMKECQRQYPKLVKIIDSKENMGAGGARNLGIKAAEGQYIGFVDSDDLIDIHMYEKLYQVGVEKDYDIVDGGYYKQEEDMAIVHTTDEMVGALNTASRKELIVSGGYIVSKIFHRRLFEDEKVCFRRNAILEDLDFLIYLYATAGTIGNVKEVLYFYRANPVSSSNVTALDKYYDNIYQAIQGIYEKMHDVPVYRELREAVEYAMLRLYSYGINVCLKAAIEGVGTDYAKKMQELADLKKKVVAGSYDNCYVQAKVSPEDIQIMKWNDEGPEKLLALIRK